METRGGRKERDELQKLKEEIAAFETRFQNLKELKEDTYKKKVAGTLAEIIAGELKEASLAEYDKSTLTLMLLLQSVMKNLDAPGEEHR